ncbi:MAG TPA: YdiU family protein [Steroidobacteraceae bacterium]|nr:YdiU family protein [Steroidobacteraceae bacterium]
MQLGFEHTYAALPEAFHVAVSPAPVPAPQQLAFNDELAAELGLDAAALRPVAHEIFSGRHLPEDARPIAMAYAGHQFGSFVPALGDGRALLLGELRDRNGVLRDVQLKGSGRTPWSRSGDGLAAVGPMLREYLVSEAMHALGIPTTRSLAVVATGTRVLREMPLPGAILTRVAASHVRVGTFQYFAARSDVDSLRTLLDYCIARHYPAIDGAEDRALEFLRAVAARQARLIALWCSVGFIHGVMNTDNMAISGETIDYGPCAFMDHYDPATVFSSIDHRGRYSFGNQPTIAQWNLARLAECLLPLMPGEPADGVERATAVITGFMDQFDAELLALMRRKLGLATAQVEDTALVTALLRSLQVARADFTQALRGLADCIESGGDPELSGWLASWRARLAGEPVPVAERRAAMLRSNPAFIPRNHRVEAALAAASDRGDMAPFNTLLPLLQRPFEEHPGFEAWRLPPEDHERVAATFCGT